MSHKVDECPKCGSPNYAKGGFNYDAQTCRCGWNGIWDTVATKYVSDLQADLARLTKANAELRQLAHDAVGPTVAWASEYQTRYELDNPHPQHQELIDRLLSAANSSEGE